MEKHLNDKFFDFSGAVNQAVGRLLKANNEVDYLENGELDKVGPITKVRGYTQRGDDVNTGYNILGMVSAYKSDGTMKQIVVADGAESSDAYTFNPVTEEWTPHILSLSTGSRAEFELFLDGFFMVNFTEATRYNDLSAWSTADNVTNAPKAKYIQLYLSRLYTAYTVSGGSTFPSRVIYSDLPTGDPLSLSWDNSTNYFDVDPDNGDVIKGLAENSSRLLIFKENSLYRYDTNTLYKVPGSPGTVANRSIGNVLGQTMYLHSTGLWGYDGTTSTLRSRKIQELIDGISTKNFANACHFVNGDHYYLYVGDVENTSTGFSVDKCLIDYDVAKNAIQWRSLENDFLAFSEYRDDRSNVLYNSTTLTYNDANTTYNGLVTSEQRMFGGSSTGEVYQMNDGQTHDGTAIAFSMTSRDYYLRYPSLYKLLSKIVVYVNPAGKGITLQYRLDGKNWKTLGRIDKEQTELRFPSASRCQRVQFRVIEKSGGGRFSFEGFDIYYDVENITE